MSSTLDSHPLDARSLDDLDDTLLAGTRRFTPQALALLLSCSNCVALGLMHALSNWWNRGPVQREVAEEVLAKTELEKTRAILAIVNRRLARFPARQRKHYTPEERFEILVLMHTYGLGKAETARLFMVDPQTVSRWEREALDHAGSNTVGTLVRADPPLRGHDDVVKRLVELLDSLKVGGSKRIAQMLARSRLRIGCETVRRYRRAPRAPKPRPATKIAGPTLRAKYANHIWLSDLTEIRGFLGLFAFKLVVILDLFSRFPLAFGVFHREPTSEQVLQVLDRAIRRHGRPRHMVTDQGSQFTADNFREVLKVLKIKQRFGAVGQYGSIAVIERFWRTVKELLGVRLWQSFSKAQLESRVELALSYYAIHRPHQGLGGATPAEVYLDIEPAAARASPPRLARRTGSAARDALPFEVVFLDTEKRLPILVPAQRAA